MPGRSAQAGFTLIEIAIVIAIVGILAGFAVSGLSAYQQRQDARGHAQRLQNLFAEARDLAMKEGNNYFILFDTPGTGDLTIVDDDNNDSGITLTPPAEVVKQILFADLRMSDVVSQYVPGTSPALTTVVPEEIGVAGKDPVPATGMTFPIDPVSGSPGIVFTPRGFPVSMPTALGGALGGPGSGRGSYYVTDNAETVYAVTLSPLGSTRLRAHRPMMASPENWF